MLLKALLSSVTILFSLIPGYGCVEIIGGHDVPPHSRPYMASIQVKRKHHCGGALIKHNWVLTAAHCAIGIAKLDSVVLGINSLSKAKGKQKFKIKNQIPHPHFKRNTGENDIMLLRLKRKPIHRSKFVSILPLPKQYSDLKAGTNCSVAGWGNTERGIPSDNLKEANITIIGRSECNKFYKGKPVITKDMLCAGDKKHKTDACSKDSGGPLICRGVYSGIVSFGDNCTMVIRPSVYTRLSETYISWINKIIKAASNTEI